MTDGAINCKPVRSVLRARFFPLLIYNRMMCWDSVLAVGETGESG